MIPICGQQAYVPICPNLYMNQSGPRSSYVCGGPASLRACQCGRSSLSAPPWTCVSEGGEACFLLALTSVGPWLISICRGMMLEDGLLSLSWLSISILWLLLVSPPFAGVSGGVKACVTVLIGYASSLHGTEKFELLSLLFLKVVPSCICVPLHCAWVWKSCLQALFRRPLDAPSA